MGTHARLPKRCKDVPNSRQKELTEQRRNVLVAPTEFPSSFSEPSCFVYKGKFYNGKVAAKRVLAFFFSIAREVELLRESVEHQNVMRYICNDQCHQLRYIPLKVCIATLQNYEEGCYNLHQGEA